MSEIRPVCQGLMQSADVWVVALIVGVSAITKIIIVCLALRGTSPAERPKIISALAEMFRWRQRSDRRSLHG